jgi:hypothetical protein
LAEKLIAFLIDLLLICIFALFDRGLALDHRVGLDLLFSVDP